MKFHVLLKKSYSSNYYHFFFFRCLNIVQNQHFCDEQNNLFERERNLKLPTISNVVKPNSSCHHFRDLLKIFSFIRLKKFTDVQLFLFTHLCHLKVIPILCH